MQEHSSGSDEPQRSRLDQPDESAAGTGSTTPDSADARQTDDLTSRPAGQWWARRCRLAWTAVAAASLAVAWLVQPGEETGGPLVNLSGQVIGIDVAGAGSGLHHVGFAVPINEALTVARQIQSGHDR